MYASKQAKGLARDFARELEMTVDEFFAQASRFGHLDIGPKSEDGRWRARDVRALNTAIRNPGWFVRITGWVTDFGRKLGTWRPNWQRPSRQGVVFTAVAAVVLVAIVALAFQAPAPEPVAEPAVTQEPTVTTEPTVEPTTEPTTVPAQVAKKVVVVGRVKTEDKPVSGVVVSVEESSSQVDGEGIFRIDDVLKKKEYTLDIVAGNTLRRITRTGGSYLSGPITDDVGEFLLSDAEVVEAETVTTAQTEAETEHIVTVKSGDTVWSLLEEAQGSPPTWDQIQMVVDANADSLVDEGVNDAGLWIVLIQVGQTIDLSAGLT